MKSARTHWLLVLIAAAVGGATLLLDPPAPEAHFNAPDEITTADLNAQAGDPIIEARERGGQLASLELLPEGRSAVSGEQAATLERPEESREAADSEAPPTLEELQEFREYIASTLVELREDEAADGLRVVEREAARLDDTVHALEARLGLSPVQSDRLRSLILARLDREAEYLRLWEKGADELILEELKTSDRKAHLTQLASILTPEQLASYSPDSSP
jgi:hypothetical protein